MLDPEGFITIVYVPVAGSVWVDKFRLVPQVELEVRVAPLGCLRVMDTQLIELFVSRTVACWFKVPPKVTVPFSPGTLLLTVIAGSPILVELEKSTTL